MSSPSLQSLQNLWNLFVSLSLEIEYGTSAYDPSIIEPMLKALESRIEEYDKDTLKPHEVKNDKTSES